MPASKAELETYVTSLQEISQLAGTDAVLAKELLLAVRAAVGEDNIIDLLLDVGQVDGGGLSPAETPRKLPRNFYSPPKPIDGGLGGRGGGGGGGNSAGDGGASPGKLLLPDTTMEASLSFQPSMEASMARTEDDAERAHRIKKLRRQSAAYPACLLLTLDTVHNVDEALRWSVGDLDNAVKQAEDDVRRLRAELRHEETTFEKLQPTASYIDRHSRSILEQIAEEEKTTLNERGVLREQTAQKMDERHHARKHVQELSAKLDILRKHAAIVKVAVTEEYEHLVATYPHLTEREIQLATHDINKLMDERKVQIREMKQLLLKGRVKRDHAIVSLDRQIAEREETLARTMLLLGEEALTTPPSSPLPSVLPPLAQTPQPTKFATKHHFDQTSTSDGEGTSGLHCTTSLSLLTDIRDKALQRMNAVAAAQQQQQQQATGAMSPTNNNNTNSMKLSPLSQKDSQPDLSVARSTRSFASSTFARERSFGGSSMAGSFYGQPGRSAKDPQTFIECESDARRQVMRIHRDSFTLLEQDFGIELLKVEERDLANSSAHLKISASRRLMITGRKK